MEKAKRWHPKAGSRKGIPNKVSREAKELIETVAGRLGGSRRLHEWVQEHPDNERAFWCLIYTKLIPYSHSISGNLTVNWPLPKSKLDE